MSRRRPDNLDQVPVFHSNDLFLPISKLLHWELLQKLQEVLKNQLPEDFDITLGMEIHITRRVGPRVPHLQQFIDKTRAAAQRGLPVAIHGPAGHDREVPWPKNWKDAIIQMLLLLPSETIRLAEAVPVAYFVVHENVWQQGGVINNICLEQVIEFYREITNIRRNRPELAMPPMAIENIPARGSLARTLGLISELRNCGRLPLPECPEIDLLLDLQHAWIEYCLEHSTKEKSLNPLDEKTTEEYASAFFDWVKQMVSDYDGAVRLHLPIGTNSDSYLFHVLDEEGQAALVELFRFLNQPLSFEYENNIDRYIASVTFENQRKLDEMLQMLIAHVLPQQVERVLEQAIIMTAARMSLLLGLLRQANIAV